MNPRSSFAASDTTYHSFHDIELQEPPSPPRPRSPLGASAPAADGATPSSQQEQEPLRTTAKMQRRDSGYESHQSGSARNSILSGPPLTKATRARLHSRPRSSTRKSAKPHLHSRASSSASSSTSTTRSRSRSRIRSQNAPSPAGYVQFPTPDLVELTETSPPADPSPHLPPPPTIHYWTSDSTRRLEYAAIDAASRGVKGWIRRHLVPDCFTPRHVAFDDDSGSVRRYRLELQDEQDEKVCRGDTRRRKGWRFFSLRKSRTI
ncbi:uncharacterized protein MAM_00627 [Metarhizium album ARSEF 1941]|uniref:Uncharacterized protein n=1 Tax=Metarhizium album (strain ARSEF 1941) TaxID=1081103 RepID=A0A0B2X8J3_METAS|nr:uncharacterized protein MAM_00627 [Metarhizium album ARSEF 1941]KHO01626.1 hypothetical protein MAM_00627 [Metarhizium album ARSEF 1941]